MRIVLVKRNAPAYRKYVARTKEASRSLFGSICFERLLRRDGSFSTAQIWSMRQRRLRRSAVYLRWLRTRSPPFHLACALL
jgi:hypothetical protein